MNGGGGGGASPGGGGTNTHTNANGSGAGAGGGGGGAAAGEIPGLGPTKQVYTTPEGKKLEIREVWAENLDAEMVYIREVRVCGWVCLGVCVFRGW